MVFFNVMEATIDEEHSYSWVVICAICQRWKNIALNSPELWSKIVFPAHTHWIQTALQRSQHLPVELDARCSSLSEGATTALAVIFNSARQRLRSVHMSCGTDDQWAELAPLFAPDAPQLRRLSIDVGDAPIDLPVPLPCDVSRIQELFLSEPWRWPEISKCTALTSLTVHHVYGTFMITTVEEVQRALGFLPHLVYLSLHRHWTCSTSPVYPAIPIARLSKLQALELGYDAVCSQLLTGIAYPASAVLKMHIDVWLRPLTSWSYADYTAYWGPIASKLSTSNHHLHAAVISSDEPGKPMVNFRAYVHPAMPIETVIFEHEDDYLGRLPSRLESSLVLKLQMPTVEARMAEEGFSRIPFSGLTRLWLNQRLGTLSNDQAYRVLARMPAVTELHLSSWTPADVACLLLARVDNELLFPNLRTLVLQNIPPVETEETYVCDEIGWITVKDAVENRRKSHATAIQRLILQHWHAGVLAEGSSALSSFVDNLTIECLQDQEWWWDGGVSSPSGLNTEGDGQGCSG